MQFLIQSRMAATPAKREVLESRHVQELAKNIDKLPERYVHKERNYGAIDASCPVAEVPVIDYSLLISSAPEVKEELDKLRSALSVWGCFQIINHGIEMTFLDKVRKVGKQFFALPMDEKMKSSRTVDDVEGYGNDNVVSEHHQTLDWLDRLFILVDPLDERKLQYWPEKPENFRETLEEYTTKTRMIKEGVFKAMARSLNLEENRFLSQLGEKGSIKARFNFYPPCPWPDKIVEINTDSLIGKLPENSPSIGSKCSVLEKSGIVQSPDLLKVPWPPPLLKFPEYNLSTAIEEL